MSDRRIETETERVLESIKPFVRERIKAGFGETVFTLKSHEGKAAQVDVTETTRIKL